MANEGSNKVFAVKIDILMNVNERSLVLNYKF